jgi:hypothetical protein
MTSADRELLAELAARGLGDYAPRRLRRLRAEHLAPSPVRREGGRARGRPSVAYPSGTADQVVAVHELRERGYSFRQIRFELLWRDSWVAPIEVLRADLGTLVDAMLGLLPEAEDPGDAVDQFVRERYLPYVLRHPRGRAQASRIKASRGERRPILEAAHLGVLGVGFGLVEPVDVNVDAVAEVYSIPVEEVPAVIEVASRVAAPIVRDRVARLSMSDVERYRPLAQDYLDLVVRMRNLPDVVAMWPGIVDQPDATDPDVRASTIVLAAVVAETIPGWAEVITSSAVQLRKLEDSPILSS